jgi:hypothetical protein
VLSDSGVAKVISGGCRTPRSGDTDGKATVRMCHSCGRRSRASIGAACASWLAIAARAVIVRRRPRRLRGRARTKTSAER